MVGAPVPQAVLSNLYTIYTEGMIVLSYTREVIVRCTDIPNQGYRVEGGKR